MALPGKPATFFEAISLLGVKIGNPITPCVELALRSAGGLALLLVVSEGQHS